MKTHIVKTDLFNKVYDDYLDGLVFYKNLGDNKTEIKLAMPKHSKYVLKIINKIK